MPTAEEEWAHEVSSSHALSVTRNRTADRTNTTNTTVASAKPPYPYQLSHGE